MSATETRERIADSGQAGFLLALSVGSLMFAFGISITLFGLTTTYLVTTVDKIGVVGTGLALLVVGAAVVYATLS